MAATGLCSKTDRHKLKISMKSCRLINPFFFSFTNSFLMLICNMSCFVFDAGMYGSTCAGSPSSPRAKFLEFGQHNRTLGHETHEKLELQ